MEAMAKLKDGQKFNEVASAYSEDKARQGVTRIQVVILCMQCSRSEEIFWSKYHKACELPQPLHRVIKEGTYLLRGPPRGRYN